MDNNTLCNYPLYLVTIPLGVGVVSGACYKDGCRYMLVAWCVSDSLCVFLRCRVLLAVLVMLVPKAKLALL